jgi:hypothetical protein
MKNLSTPLTIVYKVFGLFMCAVTLVAVMLFIIGTHNLLGLAMLLMMIPFIRLVNVYQVKYDDKNIHLKKWTKKETIDLIRVKSINEGDLLSLDPYFEIEMTDGLGGLRKINFIPDIFESFHFFWTKRLIGQLLDFKILIRRYQKIN